MNPEDLKSSAGAAAKIWIEGLQRLGLPPDSGLKEIQAAYKRLVLKYHPDVNCSGSAPERFREIAETYGRLLAIHRQSETRARKYLGELSADPRLKNMSVSELGLRLSYSSSPAVRTASAYLLGKHSGLEVRELLVKAAGDSEEQVRVTALEALGRVGSPADFLRCVPRPGRASHGVMGVFIHSAWRVWSRALRMKCRSNAAEAAR
jgi:hypothetical protein